MSQHVTRVLTVVVGMAVVVMCTVTVLQVFCRYLLDSALYWPEEVARASLVWLTFAGAAVGVRHGTHIAVTAFYRRLSGRARAIADLLISAVVAFIGYAILDLGWAVARLAEGDTSVSLGLSLFWYRLALPFGGIGILLNILPHVLRSIVALWNPAATSATRLSSGSGVV